MENKKQFSDNEGARNELSDTSMGSVMKHQYNAMPEDYRLMQCGPKPVSYSNYHSVVQQQQLVQSPSTWAPISVQQLPVHSHARNQSTDLISFHKQKSPAARPGSGNVRSLPAQQQQQQQQQADSKKNNTNYQLRSPATKRPTHGAVTMQGWLYKQGSEGLKVWRKRWFVLSDYCLYYYKGTEEEKVLGSILLPSYKVSLCTSKDKVYRKFAFKCEHANMRTYYLAAESEQAVMNWIQAVNLACMLQTNVEPDHQSNPSISSACNTLKTPDHYHQHQHHQQHQHHPQHQHQHPHQHPHPQYNTFSHPHTPTPTPSVPVPVHHVQSHSNMSVASITAGYDFPGACAGGMQPLYANAPPKPRRITGDGYSTPSPEFFLSDRYQGQCYSPYGIPNEDRCTPKNNNVYLKNCNNCDGYGTVGNNMYECNHIYDQQVHVHTPVHRDQNMERRTPDTYGRAKLNSMKMKSDKSDYEDVYADEVIYKRPLSPVAYSNIKKVSPVASITVQHRPYMPVFSSAMPAPDVRIGHKIRTPPIQPQPQQPDRIQHNTIPRPHSADFLDYEVKYRNVNKLNNANCQQPRPKSSLDISRSATDNYYYSKETYAENMRKSAMYMQHLPAHAQYHYNKENEQLAMVNGHGLYQKRKYLHETPLSARNVPHLSNGSQDSLDITRSASPYAKSPCHLKDERTYSNHRVESLPRDRDRERELERENEYHNEQFKRSASARLLRTPQEELYESVNKDGVQKREESMKRLLEWKQRMLQSPLNRKTSLGCSPHMVDRPDMYIRPVPHTHYSPHQHPPHQHQHQHPMPPETHRSYANVSVPQYSSYSSDDEENDLNRSKNAKAKTKSKDSVMHTHTHSRLLQTQAGMAGWTQEDQTDSLTNSPAPATPISASTTASLSAFDTSLNLEINRDRERPNSIQNTHSSRPPSVVNSSSTLASIPMSRTDSMLELASESKSPVSLNLSHSRIEKCENSDVDVNTTFTSTERSFYFETNDIQSSDSVSLNKQNIEAGDMSEYSKNNEQLYEDLLVLNSKEIASNIEENYMTMTPKASVLIPFSTHQRQSISSECDEGAYMEMTKGLGVSLLNQDETSNNSGLKLNGEVQPYEIVCFGDTNKIEPVYMELNNQSYTGKSMLINLANKSDLNDKNDLPDILMASKNKNMKSDSSDADDEASKDLDSLDAPCHPRFSLSDTFRPASYYLGANRVLTEFHDSSDSELVSPPPIPTSPPPMDDLDQSFFKQEKNMNDSNTSTNVADYLYSKKNMMEPLSEETAETDDCFRNKYYLSPENLKEQDYVSIYSISSDISKKRLCARSSQNSDSDIELRNCNSLEYVRKLKRRPVSEEFCDELESRFSESVDDTSYIDRYLRDLNVTNSSNASKDSPEKSNYYIKTKQTENSRRSPRYKNSSMTENITGKDESSKHKTLTHRHRKSTGNMSDCRRSITDTSDNTLLSSPTVPYYYSDVSTTATESTNDTSILFTLNNQRMDMNAGKKHITRISNPIRPNLTDNDNISKLETRCASADFLNNKYSHLDKNKLNESDIIKKENMEAANSEGVNLYYDCPNTKHSKLNGINTIRKTHSLEGLLEYVLNDSGTGTATGTGTNTRTSCDEFTDESNNTLLDTTQEGSQVWEEDSLWKERLRNASQRQTRSLDNFDHIFNESKSDKKITKLNPCAESDSLVVEPEIDQETTTPKKATFTIDRETLRQWDLLSSAPSPSVNQTVTSSTCTVSVASSSLVTSGSSVSTGNCLSTAETGKTPVASVVDADQGHGSGQGTGKAYVCERENAEFDAQHPASGSIYMQHTSHETFPRAMGKKSWNSSTLTPSRSSKLTLPMRPSHSHDFDQSRASPYFYPQGPVPATPHHQEDGHRNNVPNASWQWSSRMNMNMTAGELLGRTHEELVLLLIQLRRQSTHTCHAIETCYTEIDNIQSQLNNMSAAKRSENLQKLEYLKQHLLELEKQYEKGKPLVNLVDNMVKLGSLYRNPNDQYYNTNVKDRLEFNQQIQEQRLLAEERKDWNRFNSNHTQLQSKVQQLYQLDRLLQEESGTLQCLQYDKEKIERALTGLRLQLNKGYKDPIEIEQARKQQIRLENELSRVHYMLAQNSKKLEETVAGNARLEQELLVLRQKLQLSRQHRSSAQFSNTGAGDSLPCAAGTSAMLEAELHRVQQLVGDLQRQRQDLSVQVRQLTDRSHSLTQQMQPGHGPASSVTTPTHHAAAAAAAAASGKKRITTLWRETDLDTMVSVDHGSDWDLGKAGSRVGSATALYVNTEPTGRQEEVQHFEEHQQQQNIEDIPQEKTEIKTVRIVKRESERRQRDKEKSSSISDSATAQQKWDTVVEEVDDSFNNMYLSSPRNQIENTDNHSDSHMVDDNNHLLNRLASISSPSLYSQKGSYSADADSSIDDISIDKSPDLSPVFKSEAARQIIIEMSGGVASEPSTLKKCVRRTVPKEKRRHYTAPHNNLLSKSTFEIDNKVSVESRRARDDLDMERALRHRTDTPDVVRSTMNRKELKYNENTIDNILGTPNKINIPERYIPEQLPQLSVEEQRHRLRKVESIKKMLSDTILGSTSSVIKSTENLAAGDKMADATPLQKVTSKMVEEKRQREHLLQLNQILAKQVMEMSKIVAVKALATLPLQPQKMSLEEEDLSPVTPLPLYQQRDNFYS